VLVDLSRLVNKVLAYYYSLIEIEDRFTLKSLLSIGVGNTSGGVI